MCNIDKLRYLVDIARVLYDKSFDHGLPHVERVYNWAIEIVEKQGIDIQLDLLKTTIHLHDLGRLIGDPHAYYSSLIAGEFLKEAECSSESIIEVREAIEAHSFSYFKGSKISELGKILSDADKLDALGVVGFIRVFLYSARNNRDLTLTLKHFDEKILRLPQYMYYDYSREKANQYVERIKYLLQLLREELNNN